MLYILLFIFICILIVGLYQERSYYKDTREILCGIGIVFSIITFIAILVAGIKYNSIKSTANAQMEVLNSQNEVVLAQIEPLVQQAMNYESNTYKEFKLTPENIVAFGSMYPQLQANSFIQSQINIIVENQKEIKDLKLKIASLNAYRLWLWTKKE
jgi:hypothetical protein